MKIEGRTFVVSGGASGLGRATITNLISAGANISILDISQNAGTSLVTSLPPARSKFFQVDVSDTDSIAAAVSGTLTWVKETGKEIGGVVAAAGVSTPAKIIDRHGEMFGMGGFDFVMGVNVRGSVDLVRQLLPHRVGVEPVGEDGERGVVVLVSSSAAWV
ncbi:hypothetical protein N7G274_007938 [Stereocaulon virgatum]|uniref:Uncharacterized protein n=1 Tax=Stereocaulon virgatum TaxID=373712 RepID=A0ABR4A2I7_9LECA